MAFTSLKKLYSPYSLNQSQQQPTGVGRPSLQDHVFQFSFSYFWNHQLFFETFVKIHVKFVHSKFQYYTTVSRSVCIFISKKKRRWRTRTFEFNWKNSIQMFLYPLNYLTMATEICIKESRVYVKKNYNTITGFWGWPSFQISGFFLSRFHLRMT